MKSEGAIINLQRIGIGSYALMTIRGDYHKGLISGVIQYWLDGKTTTANKRAFGMCQRCLEKIAKRYGGS